MQDYSKKDNLEFVKDYGKSWKPKQDNIFLWILTCSLSLTIVLILILANRDYKILNKNLSDQITQKYLKTLFSEMKIETPYEIIDTTAYYSRIKIGTSTPADRGVLPVTSESVDLAITGEPVGSNITDSDIPEALIAVKDRRTLESYVRPIQQGKPEDVEIDVIESFDPWEAPVRREGKIHVNPNHKIVRGSQIIKGWRNPDEITFAIQKKEPMIEYCFKREAKFYSDMNGYIIVRFIILYSGKVDPTSVKIIRSTFRNKKIELCIKKRLQSWRGFEELDASNGSVVVTQKFIFN